MKYHDYHLESYEVSDFGESISFNLAYAYPGEDIDKSHIKFEGVALHHIINTTGSIITGIEELSIEALLSKHSTQITEWSRMFGVRHWKSDMASYVSYLKNNEFKAWEITSAIGFYGFVIAKEITNA
ncbi:hypothetical protein [Cellvibrio sp. NN19]|uniref:hypothetical protein n=1 Tax=Cellvibrio chitinivorans TaxID=3102792 RepID=UPI002B40EAF3|nr:hypothetical protein [Cellvibrio sp. NN19]